MLHFFMTLEVVETVKGNPALIHGGYERKTEEFTEGVCVLG